MSSSANLHLQQPRLFLSYAKEDKERVTEIYNLLVTEGFNPWIDLEDLIAGQDWDSEIRSAIKRAKLFLIFLSHNSVSKSGYVQKELKEALDIADTLPEDKVYIIPIKLDDCIAPKRLSRWQWLEVLGPTAYPKLIRSIEYHVERSPTLPKRSTPKRSTPAIKHIREFISSCKSVGKFVYCDMPDGRKAISNGRLLLFMNDIHPLVEELKTSRIASSTRPKNVNNVVPKFETWSKKPVSQQIEADGLKRLLIGPSDFVVAASEYYLKLIENHFPKSEIFLSKAETPIVFGDVQNKRVDGILMPLKPDKNDLKIAKEFIRST